MLQKSPSVKYAQERFRVIFDNSPIAIFEEDLSALIKLRKHLKEHNVINIHKYLFDHIGLVRRIFKSIRILELNKAALHLYGASSKWELVRDMGKTFTKLQWEVVAEEFTALLEGQSTFQAEFKMKNLSGRMCDVLMKISVPDQFKNNFSRAIVTMQDVTERKKLELYLRKLSELDGLTRLYNHNTITRRLEFEFLRAQRYGSHFSCMMIDVDHFKDINDQFGHQRGDQIIRKVAASLKESLRRVDLIGRYGGDEFLVILPETKPQNAVIAARRIQNIFIAKKFEVKKGVKANIALSIGICGYPSKGIKEVTDIVNRVDKALYDAKKEGRNRIKTIL